MTLQLIYPVPKNSITTSDFANHVRIARKYGYCSEPAPQAQCPNGYYYGGRDWVTSPAIGHPIVAAADADVQEIYAQAGGYGNGVKLNHGNGYVTIYGHMSSVAVKAGQKVKAGQVIGYTGWSGNVWDSSGQRSPAAAHLHFELRVNGIPRDSAPFMVDKVVTPDPVTPPPPAADWSDLPAEPTWIEVTATIGLRVRKEPNGSFARWTFKGDRWIAGAYRDGWIRIQPGWVHSDWVRRV